MYLRSASLLLAFCCLAMQWTPSESVPFVIPWYGRWILPTVGEVWPKPQQQTSSETFFILRPTMFQFQVLGFGFFPYNLKVFPYSTTGLDNRGTM